MNFSLWEFLRLLSDSMFVISRQTGTVPQTPATAVSRTVRVNQDHRTIYCRRSKRLHGEDALPCSLASVTTPWSSSCETTPPCSSPVRVGSVFYEHLWRRRQAPVRFLHYGRDLPPSASRTALPRGSRSFELPPSPPSFLNYIPSDRAM